MKFLTDIFARRAARKEQKRVEKLSQDLVEAVANSHYAEVEPALALEMVKTLVAEGADPTALSYRAARFASYRGMNDIFSILVKPITDQAILHEFLLDAIRSENISIFEAVLPKIKDEKADNNAALKLAIEVNNTSALEQLVRFYPELKNDTSPKNMALWAIGKDDNRRLGAIRAHYNFSASQTTTFLETAQNSGAKTITAILEKEKNKRDTLSRILVEMMTIPAQKFAEAGVTRLQELDAVLKLGSDPTYNDSEALAYAAYYGHKDCARRLLEAGAKPGDDNQRAIRWARAQNHEAIALLLERHMNGAKPIPHESFPLPASAAKQEIVLTARKTPKIV